MRLDGRRASDNVDDRRGKGPSGKVSLGIGGMIIVGLIVWLMGGNPLDVVTQQVSSNLNTEQSYTPTPEEEAAANFAKIILAGTEDIWTEIFAQNGLKYVAPKMVLFSGATRSGCGNASSSTGPFYCPADQTVYIDLSFFNQMEDQLNAGGDFAYAYVIAHEVGHHVQYLLGTLDKVHQQQQRLNEKESNQLNVRLELQADFYAGIWANHDNKNFRSIEDGDIEEGLNAASQIGDDRLQMKSQGYTVPDAFNHGTSAQRARWLKKGLQTGNISDGDTFSIPYSEL
ncbi:neutral zinc metallopeptidase [Dysgonomonas sp. Marseille-P4677]|uniref:KPN_02809 family neutral zinc metallopeptidase n=1 Tax=Dysgonomonas sp. Marseille-P4677 TaxID=2364790 RepID=UPI00191264DA|nr:neutral zinc metallopeptidase [Dysgonomonas sp. Marseille-P4677]MBK5722562.1 neutral zinc metallopeptidase [Dysgonomonas sp. Marseille-P4677]